VTCATAMPLVLRRANVSRKGGPWQHDDFDVFDGEGDVGRVSLVDAYGGTETWFRGVSFQVTRRKELWLRDPARRGQGGVPGVV